MMAPGKREYSRTRIEWLSMVILTILLLLCLQLSCDAKQPRQVKMIKIGDDIVSLEAGSAYNKAQELLDNKQYNKLIHTDAEFAEQLAFANPPIPDTSKYLLEYLANVQFLTEN